MHAAMDHHHTLFIRDYFVLDETSSDRENGGVQWLALHPLLYHQNIITASSFFISCLVLEHRRIYARYGVSGGTNSYRTSARHELTSPHASY